MAGRIGNELSWGSMISFLPDPCINLLKNEKSMVPIIPIPIIGTMEI